MNRTGISFAMLGNYYKAVEYFKEAIFYDNNFLPAYNNLFLINHLMCNFEENIDILTKNDFLFANNNFKQIYKTIISLSKNVPQIYAKENSETEYYKFLISFQNSGTHYMKCIIQILLQNSSYCGVEFNEIAKADYNKLKYIIEKNGKKILYYDHILYSKSAKLLLNKEFRNILLFRHPYETIISEIRYHIRIRNFQKPFDEILSKFMKFINKKIWRNRFEEFLYKWYKHDEILKIRYEDFILYPKLYVTSISNFYNLDYDEEKINLATIVNNIYLKNPDEIDLFPNPFKAGRGNLKGEWRNLLTQDEIKMLQDIIGDIVAELEYETE